MRQLIKMVVCVCLWFGFAMPVSAKEVGQWENQYGQIVEVTADGQVKQVANQGVAGLVQKVSQLFSQGSQQVSNWEHAPAGQPLTGLQDKGLADQSDWTRERIWDKTAPLSDFKTAVYYRVTTEKSDEGKEVVSTRQEKQATVSLLTDTKPIEEVPEEESEHQVEEQEIPESAQTDSVDEEVELVSSPRLNLSAQVEEVAVVEEPAVTSSSLGRRRNRKSSNQPATIGQTENQVTSGKKTKTKQEQLPEAGESVNELLVMLGILLLLGAGLVWKTSKKD